MRNLFFNFASENYKVAERVINTMEVFKAYLRYWHMGATIASKRKIY